MGFRILLLLALPTKFSDARDGIQPYSSDASSVLFTTPHRLIFMQAYQLQQHNAATENGMTGSIGDDPSSMMLPHRMQ